MNLRLSIPVKLGSAFAFALLSICLLGWTLSRGASTLTGSADLVQRTQVIQEQLCSALSQLADVEISQLGYVTAGMDVFLAPYESAAYLLPATLRELRTLTSGNPGQQKRLDRLEQLVASRLEFTARVVRTRQKEGLAKAVSVARDARARDVTNDIRDVIDEMSNEENRLLRQRQIDAAENARHINRLVLLGTLLAVGMSLVIGFVVIRGVGSSIGALVTSTGRLASGHLDSKVEVRTHDELGDLASAFNHMADRLKDAQDKVAEHGQILQSVLDSMSEGVTVADEQGKFLMSNPAAKRILSGGLVGALPDAWTGSYRAYRPDGATLYPTDELPLVRAVRGETVDGVLMRLGDSNGAPERWINVSARPLKYSDGPTRGGVAVISDVTPQRLSARAMEEKERLLSTVLETLPVGVWVAGQNGTVHIANRAAIEIWRGEPAAVANGDCCKVRSVETGDEIAISDLPLMRAVRVGESTIEARLRIEFLDGDETTIMNSAIPLRGRNGEVTGGIAVFQDISARVRAEEELKRANAELEAFSYSVSHDLRGPLRHMDGFADLLRKYASAGLDEKARRYVQAISESAKAMGRLIDDLLMFSRTGRAEMLHSSVDMNQLLQEVVREQAGEHPVVWKLGNLPMAHGDASLLRQVLANLISNAVKYSGGRATPRIEVGARHADGETAFFVADNGAGFDMRYAHKLFGVFQRLHSNTEFEGNGIGLAIVRRIVNRHGGRTWAEGEVDRGATFYFTIPENGRESS